MTSMTNNCCYLSVQAPRCRSETNHEMSKLQCKHKKVNKTYKTRVGILMHLVHVTKSNRPAGASLQVCLDGSKAEGEDGAMLLCLSKANKYLLNAKMCQEPLHTVC